MVNWAGENTGKGSAFYLTLDNWTGVGSVLGRTLGNWNRINCIGSDPG